MSPAHATKAGRRFEFYVSNEPGGSSDQPMARLRAKDLDDAIVDGLAQVFATPHAIASEHELPVCEVRLLAERSKALGEKPGPACPAGTADVAHPP